MTDDTDNATISDVPTPWKVICPVHDGVYLTRSEYQRQMMNPNDRWRCPVQRCNRVAEWDDLNYDRRTR